MIDEPERREECLRCAREAGKAVCGSSALDGKMDMLIGAV
jgi:hypothetical protein